MRANRFRSRLFLSMVFTCAWMVGLPQAQAEQSIVNLRAAAALVMPVTLQLNDVPLKTAVESLAEQAGVRVIWDEEELLKMDLPGEETVAMQTSQKMSLHKALCLILEPLNLCFEKQADAILITSRTKWAQRVVKVNYDVQAIVSDQLTPEALIEMIQAKVEKGSWQRDDPDQPGYLKIIGETLLVIHRQEVQQDLNHWLFDLANIPIAN